MDLFHAINNTTVASLKTKFLLVEGEEEIILVWSTNDVDGTCDMHVTAITAVLAPILKKRITSGQ